MLRLSRTILAALLLAAASATADPVATLVTVGPGDEVWEKFGHNMIRIQDGPDWDYCFNWGLFDFDKPNFVLNFVQGRMLYTMGPMKTQPELDAYQAQNRRVTFQELNLTREQVIDLYHRCNENFLKNPDYRYDYFKDNCSTRVRDMLDAVTDGRLAKATRGQPTRPPATWRSEAVRLTQDNFWVSLGIDFAIGPNADKPLDLWAEGFLPESVAQSAAFLTGPRIEAWPVTRPPPATKPPTRWPGLMLAGLLGATLIALAYRLRPWAGRTLAAVWWLVSGLGGWFMVYVWVFTDHTAAHANQNLWHFSPLAWAVLPTMLLRRRTPEFRIATTIAVVAVVGCLTWAGGRLLGGPLAQPNGGFILLSLPLNLTALWVARPALTKPPATDEVAGL